MNIFSEIDKFFLIMLAGFLTGAIGALFYIYHFGTP